MTELQLRIKEELEKDWDARPVDIARKLGISSSMVGTTKQFLLHGKRKVECSHKKLFAKIKISAECPTCHCMHLVVWKGKQPEKPPKIYCPKHKGNRNVSEYGGGNVVPAKPTARRAVVTQ